MLAALASGLKVPDVRKRLAFTAFILVLYRTGSYLPTPGVDTKAVQSAFNGQNGAGGTILSLLNNFSGQALQNLSFFALGIMPYITASIIVQLLTVVIPTLEKAQKEGETGQKKITQLTRYLTVGLAIAQSAGYTFLFSHGSAIGSANVLPNLDVQRFLLIVTTLTAGATLLMWLGELITRRGLGNGQSLLIFASIIVSTPPAINAWLNGTSFQKLSLPFITLAVVAAVVFIQEGQRRIPIQYAKRMVGSRMTSGSATYMPLRVNMAGVIPVIFAAAILFFPPTVGQLVPRLGWLSRTFQYTSWPSIILEFCLILGFTFFYTAVQFNPVDQADNLRKFGGFIPGIRPGRPTAQYLDYVITRLTLPGALFLAVIAVAPTLFIKYAGFSHAVAQGLGGTSILIIVGVALDTVRQMESQIMMRNYEGFLR